jgi:hypothetical protein
MNTHEISIKETIDKEAEQWWADLTGNDQNKYAANFHDGFYAAWEICKYTNFIVEIYYKEAKGINKSYREIVGWE